MWFYEAGLQPCSASHESSTLSSLPVLNSLTMRVQALPRRPFHLLEDWHVLQFESSSSASIPPSDAVLENASDNSGLARSHTYPYDPRYPSITKSNCEVEWMRPLGRGS